MVSIVIRNLTKRFGEVVALDDVSLTIEAGELFFLLGPSGCGKTTLLRTIAGFSVPGSGQVFFDDKEVTRTPPHRRNTAMMFQSYALWPHMTVAKNVAFGLEEQKTPKSEIEERVGKALDMVKMIHCADRKINELSGGQQQRVALARALVVRPRCLLLDEPLSNLDAKLRLEMRSEIRRICKQFGLTAIYVTHDQKEALSMADRMAILENGRISQVGTPEDVYRNPLTRTVASFIGETNFIEGSVIGVEGDNRYRIKTSLGEFVGRATGARELRTAAAVCLSIRPECLVLQRDGNANADLPNSISGRLHEATYLGELAQYTLETGAPSKTIHISELNPTHLKEAAATELIAVAAPHDVVILPA